MRSSPAAQRGGDILLADSTIFSTLFGGDESLERFWKSSFVTNRSRTSVATSIRATVSEES
jgi:hypothetical protein